ncbi:MAG: hypothetical protein ACE1ZC_01205, partial [Nitrososphaerales archaeon]
MREKSSSEEEREKAREDAALLNVVLLEKAGLDIVYDGEARRVEMYEYSAKRIKGMRFSGRVRSWDAKYYRKARCVGKVGYTGNYHLDEFNFVRDRATKMIKVPITGAYTIAPCWPAMPAPPPCRPSRAGSGMMIRWRDLPHCARSTSPSP